MCRLYGFLATEETKVECTLVHAQNALMAQSRSDMGGTSHSHGWGVATFGDKGPEIERQAWAAYHGEHFERAAARAYATLVLAHVRRATVGGTDLHNTHPFVEGRWTFAHNGTIPGFAEMREELRARLSSRHRDAIKGVTDSEHVFRLFLTRADEGAIDPDGDMIGALRAVAGEITDLAEQAAPDKRLGLNMMITDGERLFGTRLNRGLCFVDRMGVYDCEICGFPHIHHDPNRDYRAIVVASEPLTHEDWSEIPNHSIWEANLKTGLQIHPLRVDA